jgi:outer membrane immunogenic protein
MRRLFILPLCAGVVVGAAGAVIAAPEEPLLPAAKSEPVAPAVKSEPAAAAPAPKSEAATKAEALSPGVMHDPATTSSVYRHEPRRRRVHVANRHTLITKAPPPVIHDVRGPSFYAGLHLGGGWTNFRSPADAQDIAGSGVIGGGQFGWNYQMGSYVFGVEADFTASGVRADQTADLYGITVNGSVRNEWFATLAGRFGFANGRLLSYLKAGGAWTRYRWNFDAPGLGTAFGSDTRGGWMIGAGLEQALTSDLSAKIEYNYMDFGSRTETLTTTGGLAPVPTDVRLDVHMVKVGFNRRFSMF